MYAMVLARCTLKKLLRGSGFADQVDMTSKRSLITPQTVAAPDYTRWCLTCLALTPAVCEYRRRCYRAPASVRERETERDKERSVSPAVSPAVSPFVQPSVHLSSRQSICPAVSPSINQFVQPSSYQFIPSAISPIVSLLQSSV